MNTRYACPECGKRNEFTRYIDTDTGEHLHPSVGKCNRETKCGYHKKPKQYFEQQGISLESVSRFHTLKGKKQETKVQPSFIPFEILRRSRTEYENNYFVQFLATLFDAKTLSEVISRYHIGTSNYWNGATVFWQIDIQGNVRAGKIMLYSPDTGKRIKEPYDFIQWAHNALKQPEYNLVQCFFGEHLLKKYPHKAVAIVESEKTAVIASAYFPNFIWLAAGNKNGLNPAKCKVLQGRNVVLFPDLKAYNEWRAKAKELSAIANFTTSDFLETKATEAERQQGFDLADYLIMFDYKKFNSQPTKPTKQKAESTEAMPPTSQKRFEVWKVEEMESYFLNIALHQRKITLDKCGTITDLNLFIQSHLATIKTNNGNPTYLPYLERLQQVKNIFSNSIQ
jgi:hypothetical protein